MKMLKKISTFFMTLPLLVACGNKGDEDKEKERKKREEQDKKELVDLYGIIELMVKLDSNVEFNKEKFEISSSSSDSSKKILEDSKKAFSKASETYNKKLKLITGKDDGSIKINDFEYKKISVKE